MIWRTTAFILSAALAYALLRGWPESLPGVMKACVAVLALVAGLGVWAKRPPQNDEAHAKGRRSPHWLDYLSIAGAVLAVECGFLWLLGTAPQHMETVALEIERRFRPEEAALRVVHNDQTRQGNWLWTAETRRPLPRRTDFKPGMKPEVFVRLEDPSDSVELLRQKVYVRAFALSRYEQAAWAPLPGKPLRIEAGENGWIQLEAVRPGKSIRHEIFHSADPAGQNVFTALQGASSAGISPLERVDDGLHLLPASTKTGGYQYQADSRPMRIEDLPEGELISSWPNAPDELLALPPGEFATRLRLLSRSAAGVGSMKQQLRQLQDHLKGSLRYSLETTNFRDLDPIENFLFEEKRGHCEYFATAGALMIRALGIPSRVAYGWAGGKWFEHSGMFVFRANEAHAWTEVWLQNHGWVILDATPVAGGNGDRAQVAAPGETLPDDTQASDETTDTTLSAADSDFPKIALWLMAAFALPAGLIAILRSRARTAGRTSTAAAHDFGSEAPAYLESWRRACISRGFPVAPGTTLRRQISRLPAAPDFAGELVDYHYGIRYENRPADKRTEKNLIRRIRGWESEFSGINAEPPHSHPGL